MKTSLLTCRFHLTAFRFERRTALLIFLCCLIGLHATAAGFKAGASVVDISPTGFPVIVNAMFTERSATNTVDPLRVRSLVLEQGSDRFAIAVVDTCMMARSLIDQAKELAARETGIPVEKMMVSATHTHSAPSAMGCLGSRMDENYARFLVPKIAESIRLAASNLVPARAGWTVFDAAGYTHNRRWIRRSDRIEVDPFGERTVRAHMHPGHQSPDVVGPSGPVDSSFTLFSVVDLQDRPIALMGNFSMHYYESGLVSSDYFGKWCAKMETRLGSLSGSGAGSRPVVGIMSQGTSGDLMWMDYSSPRKQIGYEAYAEELASRSFEAWRGIQHRGDLPIRMAESKLNLSYRLCDESRLAWARKMASTMGNRLPKTLPEVYALEQIQLHERGRTELKLQALRIGSFGMTAIPNEVFAITGLKLKEQSPLSPIMNIELANGAEGYIPPPEQHALGGYTTWAARTAGLETNAEPQITEGLIQLLEKVSGAKRRSIGPQSDARSKQILHDSPLAYWRLDESGGRQAKDCSGNGNAARYDGLLAYWLNGPVFPAKPNSVPNRAVHFVKGSLTASVKLPKAWTLEFWMWNGILKPADVVGSRVLQVSLSDSEDSSFNLSLGGSGENSGRLQVGSSSLASPYTGAIEPKTWHHVAISVESDVARLYLDGRAEQVWSLHLSPGRQKEEHVMFRFGGAEGPVEFQGKLDDIAVFGRALTAAEIQNHAALE